MPTRPERKLDTPEQAVRDANHRFYRALASLSLQEMEAVWLREDWVECVHPGWDMLLGWEEVQASFVRIFSSTRRIQMEIHSVWVRVEGDVAWVACTEHVTSTFDSGFDQALAQATNIFVRRDIPAGAEGQRGESQWFLVAHHASPLPAGQPPRVQ
ncbi:MAG TPA: nuclear transport factor 2 family protein [Candidatus Dormibacteraeota bacterium]|nr:nuclear transport factor 2 family protein [Candidatus Dormibacteraeota bacterium]